MKHIPVTLATAGAEDVVPRLLAAPAPTTEGAGAVRAMSASQSIAESADAAPAATTNEHGQQWWPAWMPRVAPAAKTSSILTYFGLRGGDGQAELDELIGERAEANAASNIVEPLPPTREAEHGPTSAAVAAWRQGADFAASAARQLQAALLGLNPFPARAHFGSHTYLHPVAANVRLTEDGGSRTPQSPEQRYLGAHCGGF